MNHQTGRERGRKLLELAEELDDDSLRLQAHHSLWATSYMLGDQIACREHIDRGLELYDETRHKAQAAVFGGHDARVCAHGENAVSLWLLGQPDTALRSVKSAIDFACTLAHPPSLVHAGDYELMLSYFRQDEEAVSARADEMIEFARERSLPDYEAKCELFHGWASMRGGDTIGGLREMERGLQRLDRSSTKEDLPVFLEMMARAYLVAEHPELGLIAIDRALREAHETGVWFWNAELHRCRGDLLLAAGNGQGAPAEEEYREALKIAGDQHAKSLQLRAAVSLARSMKSRPGATNAQRTLATIYSQFREGFDTPDLIEARNLLEGAESRAPSS